MTLRMKPLCISLSYNVLKPQHGHPLLYGGAGLGNYYIIRLIPEARLTPPHSWGQPRNSDRQTQRKAGSQDKARGEDTGQRH